MLIFNLLMVKGIYMLTLQRKILEAVSIGIFLAMVSGSACADMEVWRLDLSTESGEVGPEAFSAWMETKG